MITHSSHFFTLIISITFLTQNHQDSHGKGCAHLRTFAPDLTLVFILSSPVFHQFFGISIDSATNLFNVGKLWLLALILLLFSLCTVEEKGGDRYGF